MSTNTETDDGIEMTNIRAQIAAVVAWVRGALSGAAPNFSLPDAPTEAGTKRNGVLSYAAEWHALEVGAFAGVAYGVTGRPEIAGVVAATTFGVREAKVGHMKDAREEVGYTGTGFVLGVGIGTLLRAANGGSVDVANVVDVIGQFVGSVPL